MSTYNPRTPWSFGPPTFGESDNSPAATGTRQLPPVNHGPRYPINLTSWGYSVAFQRMRWELKYFLEFSNGRKVEGTDDALEVANFVRSLLSDAPHKSVETPLFQEWQNKKPDSRWTVRADEQGDCTLEKLDAETGESQSNPISAQFALAMLRTYRPGIYL